MSNGSSVVEALIDGDDDISNHDDHIDDTVDRSLVREINIKHKLSQSAMLSICNLIYIVLKIIGNHDKSP